MTLGLVHAGYSLPESQSVKLTFFNPIEPTSCYFQCENEIKTSRSKLALNAGEDEGDSDENGEKEDVELESDDDDDEPTLMSRSKHFAKQVS